MTDRIGMFICECGPHITDALDIQELIRFARRLEAVVRVEPVGLLCEPDWRERVAETIRRHDITHVVFAGCSPGSMNRRFETCLKPPDAIPS